MSFATIFTSAGLSRMSAAAAAGQAINVTHMAVGDGDGNAVTPAVDQTALEREVYRATVNRVYRPDPVGNPTTFAAELVVPASEGGFVMREVGVFLDDGTLFAVGNLPETYKPEAAEGAFADTVVRVDFIASNVDVITLIVDPNTAVASQTWVTNNITAGFLLPGGLTGQVLTKQSNADGDTYWADPAAANVVVNTIEEYQTLASAQTVVNLSTVTTYGLAVFIDGTRLREDATADGWQPDGGDPTILTLGQSYPAGTEITMVQNEPTAGLPEFLRKDQNLADVPNKALARANLGVDPPGQISFFAGANAPPGWLKCNGALLSRTVYADLFNVIGTTFGNGDGVTTFRLPDCRGEFFRALDEGRGLDPGRVLGTIQDDAIGLRLGTNGAVVGSVFVSTSRTQSEPLLDAIEGMAQGNKFIDSNTASVSRALITPSFETRPRNRAWICCIKF